MKINTKMGFKRIGAYILDMILVELVIYLLFSINIFNPHKDEYNAKYSEYSSYYEKYTNKEITDEEYKAIYMQYNYELSRLDVSYALINIGVVTLYFGLFEYLSKGQTLGKRILGLKVVSKDNKKLHFYNFLIRTLLVNSLAVMLIKALSLLIPNQVVYYYICYYFTQIDSVLQLLIVFMIFLDPNGIALHDKLSCTRVIDLRSNKKDKEDTKEQKVIVNEDEKLKNIKPIEKEAK